MAELIKLGGPEDAGAHVIFFHGLRGSIERTWSSGASSELWPSWLADDIDGLAIWAVEFSANATCWGGKNNMALPDLASTILQIITHQHKLEAGNIALVGYSLGGVVAKHVLRTAEDRKTDTYADSFYRRVERVATIASPHAGSGWVEWPVRGRWVLRPTRLTLSLRAGDRHLANLHEWFRHWGATRQDRVLAFLEGQDTAVGRKVVETESASAGGLREILTEETHRSIVQVTSREKIVYLGLQRFLREMAPSRMRVAPPVLSSGDSLHEHLLAGVDGQGASSRLLLTDVSASSDEDLGGLVQRTALPPASKGAAAILDAEVDRRLARLRRGRFVVGFPRDVEARGLIEQVERGELQAASAAKRAEALAWTARILAQASTEVIAREALATAEALEPSILTKIAGAFLLGLTDRAAALQLVSRPAEPIARSAGLYIAGRGLPAADALSWFEATRLSSDDLDPDGQLLLMSLLLQERRWNDARELALCADHTGGEAPQFLLLAALAHITWVLPEELREVLVHVPLHPRTLPLAADEAAMADRRSAISLLDRFQRAASDLQCQAPADLAEDLALWLRLRDPQTTAPALEILRDSTRDSGLSLRRFALLLDYGVDVDLTLLERAIEREEALTGGGSAVAAVARFAYSFTRENPAAAAAYIRQHWDNLQRHLAPGGLAATEVELLARAGQTDEAVARLSAIPNDALDAEARARLTAVVTSDRVADPGVTGARARYELSQSISNLMTLVDALTDARDWVGVTEYAEALLERTRDVGVLVTLVRAANKLSDFKATDAALRAHPNLVEQSPELRMHWAWSLFRSGELEASRAALEAAETPTSDSTILRINLAITSGRWNDLHEIVEEIYQSREVLDPGRLLQAAQLARNLGSDRVDGLVRAAAARGNDDANILVGAYTIASSSGLEVDPEVAGWLSRAAALSGDEGPVQAVSLEEIVERQPDWQAHQAEVSEKIATGQLPLFACAKLLNRTLTEMLLVTGLTNLHEPDSRSRTILPIRAGVAKPDFAPISRVALDPSSILVLLLCGLFRRVIDSLDHVVLPHGTLAWLFEERQRLPFHQPSRIRDAQKVRDLLAEGGLQLATSRVPLPSALPAEVGVELAELMAEARSSSADGTDHLLIRTAGVHRPGSLSGENARLDGYDDLFRTGSALIDSLWELGRLSETERQRASALLTRDEVQAWTGRRVPAGATIYLEALAVGNLLHAGILDRLAPAGFTVFISGAAAAEYNTLLSYDRRAGEVDGLIAEARSVLETGLREGKVTLGRALRAAKNDEQQAQHPTEQLLERGADLDAIVVDDRAVGRHDNVKTDTGLTPILSSFELLNWMVTDGRLADDLRRQAQSRLRNANAAFLPVEVDELQGLLSAATEVRQGRLVETMELKAVRENVQNLAASRFLQLPHEGPWLLRLMAALREAMRAQWGADVTDVLATARTEWLLDLHDGRMWAHRLLGTFDEARAAAIYIQPLLMVINRLGADSPEARRYGNWVETALLPKLRRDQPKLYEALTSVAAQLVEDRFDGEASP